MRPGRVHLFLLVDTCLSKVQIALFHVGKGTEDVFLNHLHDLVEVGDYDAHHVFLVLQHLLELCDSVQAFSLYKSKKQNDDENVINQKMIQVRNEPMHGSKVEIRLIAEAPIRLITV